MLSPYRILDLCDERGAWAGRVLADLGAEVIRIEPPGGDPLRRRGPAVPGAPPGEGGLAWQVAQAGKRGLVLDLFGDEADRETFRALAARADVVLEGFAPGALEAVGLDADAVEASLPAAHPGLVWCSITPFGREGPYAGFAAGDLVCVAMGGNASMTGDPDRPPLRCSLPTAPMHVGPEAVVGVLLALYGRADLGRGQRVDVSMQETQLSTLITGAAQVASGGPLGRRSGPRTGRTREIWRCRDGYVSFGLRGGPARAPSLEATVDFMAETGHAPDWLRGMDWKTYSPLTLDEDELARLEATFAAFFETRTMRDLYEEALARRILLAPCNDAREILAQPQLRARDFFARIPVPGAADGVELPGAFAKSSAAAIGVRGPAPTLDADGPAIRAALERDPVASEPAPAAGLRLATRAGERGVLEGLRVLELGSGAAGPVATRYLAEQGATVIRIESSRRPDFLRLLHVTRENRDEPDVLERAPMFVLLNPDKQSLAVDLSAEEGRALVRRLIDEWADVVSENFAPGVMARWGLDGPSLLARRPDLVMASGCLFGQTGPQRRYPGFGGQGAAIAGFNHMTGWPDREALGPYATVTDSLAPRFVATALLAALLHLRRTGEGQHLDVSQIEAGVYGLSEMIARCSATGEVMARLGNRAEDAAPHGIYPCRAEGGEDDAGGDAGERWIALAVRDDAAWQRLVEAMGSPAWAAVPALATAAGRLRAVEALDERIAAWTAGQSAGSLMDALQAVGLEAGVVRDFRQLATDPQLAARGHFVRRSHPVLGELAFERSGFRLSASPGGLHRAGPRLGEHTRAVLADVLGLSPETIDDLEARGITV